MSPTPSGFPRPPDSAPPGGVGDKGFVSPPTKKLPWLANTSGFLRSSRRLSCAAFSAAIVPTRISANVHRIVITVLQIQKPEGSYQLGPDTAAFERIRRRIW